MLPVAVWGTAIASDCMWSVVGPGAGGSWPGGYPQRTTRTRSRHGPAAGAGRGLAAGHGHIVAEFFDVGQSRALAWARRPQAAALVAALADPDRGFDAIVVGEYERGFYGGQYASMAPLFEHSGIQLWTPRWAAGSTSC